MGSNAGAALLFQDRYVGANGEETIYRFEANDDFREERTIRRR
jgi:hypothetical protein